MGLGWVVELTIPIAHIQSHARRATLTAHLRELGCGRLGAQAAKLATAYLLGCPTVQVMALEVGGCTKR